MTKTQVLCASGIAAAAIGVAAVIALPHSGSSAQADALPPHAEASAQLKQVVGSFSRAATAADALPTFLQTGPQAYSDVDPTTARFEGMKDGVRYWVAVNTAGQGCVISLLPGDGQMSAMTCGDPDSISSSGLGIQLADATHSVRAYVVPDGYKNVATGLTSVGTRLLIGSSAEPTTGPIVPSTQSSSARSASASSRETAPSTVHLSALEELSNSTAP